MGISQSKYNALQKSSQKTIQGLKYELMQTVVKLDATMHCNGKPDSCNTARDQNFKAALESEGLDAIHDYVQDLQTNIRTSAAKAAKNRDAIADALRWSKDGNCKDPFGNYVKDDRDRMVSKTQCLDPDNQECWDANGDNKCAWDEGSDARKDKAVADATAQGGTNCFAQVAAAAEGKILTCEGKQVDCDAYAAAENAKTALSEEKVDLEEQLSNTHILGDGREESSAAFYCKFNGASELQYGYDSGVARACEYNWKNNTVSNTCYEYPINTTLNRWSRALCLDENKQDTGIGECFEVKDYDLKSTTIDTKDECNNSSWMDGKGEHLWVATEATCNAANKTFTPGLCENPYTGETVVERGANYYTNRARCERDNNHPAYGMKLVTENASSALEFNCDNIKKLVFLQPDSDLDGECLAVDAKDDLVPTTITTKDACDAEDRHTWVARDHRSQLVRAKMKQMQDEINRLNSGAGDATKVCYNEDTLDYSTVKRSEAECTAAGGIWREWSELVSALTYKLKYDAAYECVKCDTNPEANNPYWDDSCEVVRGDNPSALANKSECATKGGVWKKRWLNEQGKVDQKNEQLNVMAHAMCQVADFRQAVPACGAASVEERAAGVAEKWNLFLTVYNSSIGTARSEEEQKCRKDNAETQNFKDNLAELVAWDCDAGALVTQPWECHTGGCKKPDGAYATDSSGTVLSEEQCAEPNAWDGEIVATETKDDCYGRSGQVVDGEMLMQCAPPPASSPPECSTGDDTSLYNAWKNSQDTTFCAARGKENNFPTGVCKEGPPQGMVMDMPGMEQELENNFARWCGDYEPCDANTCISDQQNSREWIALDRNSATRDEFYRAMLVQGGKWEKWEPWPRCREQIKWIRETFGDAILTDEEIRLHGHTCNLDYIEPDKCSTLLTYAEAKLGHRAPTEEENARRRNLPDHSNSACFTHTTEAACVADTSSGGDGLGCKWNPSFWDSANERLDPKCMPALCEMLNPCKMDGRATYESSYTNVMDIPSTHQNSGVWECVPRPNRDAACSTQTCQRGSVHQCMMDGLSHGAPENCCAMHKLDDDSGDLV